MKLHIKNFAKIEEADIIVDGITVIAGENNTGKSTVGKIIFSLFNALYGIEGKILNERMKEIEFSNRGILANHFTSADIPRPLAGRNVINIAKKIRMGIRNMTEENPDISESMIRDVVEKAISVLETELKSTDSDVWQDMTEELIRNTNEILFLPEINIVMEVITRNFKNVFHTQINSLTGHKNDQAILELDIKGKVNRLVFVNDECRQYDDEINITHKAIYIDNPFVVDELSDYNDLNPMNDLLRNLLTVDPREGMLDGIIESMRTKEKLADIFNTLQSVVDGEIVLNKRDEFSLKNDRFDEPISFYNLSTGLKSFVILKMLLEKGCLKEKDVVILDEPEVHLHPQWQVAYAELIVLLQKRFDLSVIVTTHSPYFVDALNLFSMKYRSSDKVNYYLSSSSENEVKMVQVTGNIDLIYKKMASPIQMLDTLRYELNNTEGNC